MRFLFKTKEKTNIFNKLMQRKMLNKFEKEVRG